MTVTSGPPASRCLNFESALRAYPTADKANEFLRRDVGAVMQKQLIDLYREPLQKKKLAE